VREESGLGEDVCEELDRQAMDHQALPTRRESFVFARDTVQDVDSSPQSFQIGCNYYCWLVCQGLLHCHPLPHLIPDISLANTHTCLTLLMLHVWLNPAQGVEIERICSSSVTTKAIMIRPLPPSVRYKSQQSHTVHSLFWAKRAMPRSAGGLSAGELRVGSKKINHVTGLRIAPLTGHPDRGTLTVSERC